jgi:acyl-CoA synthetase (AMP-forming)/AMP-acid ligase II
LLAPAKTPAEIVRKLNAAAIDAIKNTELRDAYIRQGNEPAADSAEAFAALAGTTGLPFTPGPHRCVAVKVIDPRGNEVMWTPAEWAWIAGLYDALFPAWYYGTPVLAHRFSKFDPERAFAMLAKHRVGVSFIPPTALKMMRQVRRPRDRWTYEIRAISTGGEAMGGGAPAETGGH